MFMRCYEEGCIPIPTRPKASPNLNAVAGEVRPFFVPLADFASAWRVSPSQMQGMLRDNGLKVFESEGEVYVIQPLTAAKLLEAVHKPAGAPHHD